MSHGDSLDDFSGTARLFPLPNFVLLPHVVKPLLIFEPRYRAMARDALAGDELLALVLLKPDWESEYELSPAVHDVACLARIIKCKELIDGRFNILVRGECRLRLDEEVDSNKPYRLARGTLLPDADEPEDLELRSSLEEAVRSWLAPITTQISQFKSLFRDDMSLSALCDVVAFAMPIAAESKQAMLEELDVAERVHRLMTELETTPLPRPEELPQTRSRRQWPPNFSQN